MKGVFASGKRASSPRASPAPCSSRALGCLFGTTSFFTGSRVQLRERQGRSVCVIYQSSERTAEVRGRALLKSGPSPGPAGGNETSTAVLLSVCWTRENTRGLEGPGSSPPLSSLPFPLFVGGATRGTRASPARSLLGGSRRLLACAGGPVTVGLAALGGKKTHGWQRWRWPSRVPFGSGTGG